MGRISLKDTEKLAAFVEKPHMTRFWGSEYDVKPAFVSEILGKGDALLGIHPVMYRPNYYVIRIDRRWFEGDGICDHLDEIHEAIEGEYPADEIEHKEEDGTISTYYEWPYVGMDGGSSWWRYYLYGDPQSHKIRKSVRAEMQQQASV